MKIAKYIALSSVMALGLTSCNDWLDVNVNPDQPNNESIVIENRLPWVLKEITYSTGCSGTRSFATAGGFYSNNASMNSVSVTWAGNTGIGTTPYQTFFVGTGSNLVDLYNKAEEQHAYHYMGAAEVIYAIGFMQMLDLYGEIPYTEALGSALAPKYDEGKTIWEGCLSRLDHAIELFNTAQPAGTTPLSAGDIWNGGDVAKWIKLCYGLKARYLLRVTKNPDYYRPDEILDCLTKAPQSNNDNTFQACYDIMGDLTDKYVGDPVQTNGTWCTAAYGKNQWVSKFFLDMLTNMRGAGVDDPRLDKIIPMTTTDITFDASGNINSYKWRRSEGVDLYGDAARLVAGGATSISVQSIALKDVEKTYSFKDAPAGDMDAFIAALKAKGYPENSGKLVGGQYKLKPDTIVVCYPAGAWYVDNNNYISAGDTAYVNFCSGSVNTNNGAWGMPVKDTFYHSNTQAAAKAGAISGTGSFKIFAISDFDVLTYSEMCFIKAEVLFRKGDTGGALTAYKAGIQAHIDRMQTKLSSWAAEGYGDNPSMTPMDDAAIAAYMASGAVCQNAGELTMSDIMLQKYISMSWTMEDWVDMRRFNYSAGNIGDFGVVYPNYGRTKLFTGGSSLRGTEPNNPEYWIRRWRACTHEVNYNSNSLEASNANALKLYIWGIPVWWDCSSDAEYQNYLK